VQVNCQQPASFQIEADDNLLPLVQTEVRDGVLRVSTTKGYSSDGGIVLRVTVPDLVSVKSTGAGKFQRLKREERQIRDSLNGAATVVASGQSRSLKISSTGAGKIDAHDLLAKRCRCRRSPVRPAWTFMPPTNSMSRCPAPGRVTYSGNPKVEQESERRGTGDQERRDQRLNSNWTAVLRFLRVFADCCKVRVVFSVTLGTASGNARGIARCISCGDTDDGWKRGCG